MKMIPFGSQPTLVVLLFGVAIAGAVLAQEVPPLEDNSFLIEEAYNQEPGVVQHVFTFEHPEEGSDASLTFTQEWPLFSQRHQLSYSVPFARLDGDEGLGDVSIDYRYQAIGLDGGPLAVSPRLSLVLPTGDDDRSLGTGAAGLEAQLPVSVELGERVAGHWNVAASYTPDARGPGGAEADVRGIELGQGLVFLLRPTLNLLLEAVWSEEEEVTASGGTDSARSFFISPGVRFAFNRPSGLQIVPGIAFPIGVGPSDGDRAVFLYLSFEHGFGK